MVHTDAPGDRSSTMRWRTPKANAGMQSRAAAVCVVTVVAVVTVSVVAVLQTTGPFANHIITCKSPGILNPSCGGP